MAYECRVEADSLSPVGIRLVSWVVTYPRIILAEMNTHRMFSRSTSSSRAIPVKRLIGKVKADPFKPELWGKNQRGMQPAGTLCEASAGLADQVWEESLDEMIDSAEVLDELNVHKQWVNRLLEPFSWVSTIITATDFNNFFALRCHPDAQQEIQKIAGMMRDTLQTSIPKPISCGEWHLPFVTDQEKLDYDLWTLKRFSAARCARVSYTNHDGHYNMVDDLRLANDLIGSKPLHASVFEHQATPDVWYTEKFRFVNEHSLMPGVSNILYTGNFYGWVQARKELPNECVR